MKVNSNPVRGTRDILPREMEIRDRVQQVILQLYRSHGFERIETPIIENLDLLLNSDGGENLKMLFKVLKRGKKLKIRENSTVRDLCDIGLRYDLTLPLSRFFANNKNSLQYPFKAIQIDNVFRAERPQKGRFRSFKQCDIDIIGDKSQDAEVELIYTTAKALQVIGFNNFTVRINDRRILAAIVVASGFKEEDIPSVSISLDKLDKIGNEGIKAELIEKGYDEKCVSRLTDCISELREDNVREIVEDDEVVKGLNYVMSSIRELSEGNYQIIFDPTLVRGMGYYTGQIFEISYSKYGFSIAGGGRYDNMIGNISKEDIPAVGFSIGFERIVSILLEEEKNLQLDNKKLALLYYPEHNFVELMKKSEALRDQGYSVTVLKAKKKLNRQLNELRDLNYKYFTIYGGDDGVKVIN